jgi:phosphatidate cytidylyltransferase
MIEFLRSRFWDVAPALKERFTVGSLILVVSVIALSGLLIAYLRGAKKVDEKLSQELVLRWRSWVVIALLLFAPILIGPGWVILGVCLLSLLCYREFAQVTGVDRHYSLSAVAAIGILMLAFASLDNYFRLFTAIAPLTVGLIAIVSILHDQPQGYLQRTSLSALGFVLFGYCLGYLGYFANSPHFRPIVILILLCVELNDVYAFCCGKLLGGPKAIPATSPGKTWTGCIGALIFTTATVYILGSFVFAETAAAKTGHLLFMGASLSVLGQFGDLLLSSIKRDVGVKDMGTLIPGHGGLLDRFDSLVLLPPAALHYLSVVLTSPIGAEPGVPQRFFTGG